MAPVSHDHDHEHGAKSGFLVVIAVWTLVFSVLDAHRELARLRAHVAALEVQAAIAQSMPANR